MSQTVTLAGKCRRQMGKITGDSHIPLCSKYEYRHDGVLMRRQDECGALMTHLCDSLEGIEDLHDIIRCLELGKAQKRTCAQELVSEPLAPARAIHHVCMCLYIRCIRTIHESTHGIFSRISLRS
jgi:hypothetical protein